MAAVVEIDTTTWLFFAGGAVGYFLAIGFFGFSFKVRHHIDIMALQRPMKKHVQLIFASDTTIYRFLHGCGFLLGGFFMCCQLISKRQVLFGVCALDSIPSVSNKVAGP